jgi:hypothetical protein
MLAIECIVHTPGAFKTPKTPGSSTFSSSLRLDANIMEKTTKLAVHSESRGPELIGITASKSEDFSEWYQQVTNKGQMLEFYDVPGC